MATFNTSFGGKVRRQTNYKAVVNGALRCWLENVTPGSRAFCSSFANHESVRSLFLFSIACLSWISSSARADLLPGLYAREYPACLSPSPCPHARVAYRNENRIVYAESTSSRQCHYHHHHTGEKHRKAENASIETTPIHLSSILALANLVTNRGKLVCASLQTNEYLQNDPPSQTSPSNTHLQHQVHLI